MDRLHILIDVENGLWLAPINGLGQADVDYKDERSVAKALRKIADEFETGMGYHGALKPGDLLVTDKTYDHLTNDK